MRTSVCTGTIITCFIFAAPGAHAQGMRFTGRVLSDSAQPLQSAQVFVEGTGSGVITDVDGTYSFLLPASRLHGQMAKLTARLIGYRPTSVGVVLTGSSSEHDFALVPQALQSSIDLPIARQPPSTFTTAAFLDDNADIARTAGLRELRETRHGDRELRIWKWGGRFYQLYRLVEQSEGITAERIRYVKVPVDPRGSSRLPMQIRDDVTGCTPRQKGMVTTCREDLRKSPEWKLSWDELERAGIWDLPSEETQRLPIYVEESSGSMVTVELWDGHAYRAWSFLSSDEATAGWSGNGRDRADALWRATRVIDSHAHR